MRIKCYLPGCYHYSRDISWGLYLWLVCHTKSLKPWVCEDHYDLFQEEDTLANTQKGGENGLP